jgi:echinoid
LNTKGSSEYSNEIATTTKVNKISPALHATFDPTTRTLGVNVGATCLALVAIVESVINGNTPEAAWQVIDQIPLSVSGSATTYKETVIDQMITARRSSARSLGDDDLPAALEDELNPRVRVKLCLKANTDHCSDYTEAESKRDCLIFICDFY